MLPSQLNGDSTVTCLKYEDGVVYFDFEDGETGKDYKISVNTQRFASEASEVYGAAHIRVIDLIDVLPVDEKSKIYIMPCEFGEQMKINKNFYNLALGLKSTEFPFMLVVQGNNKILVCPIKSENEVKIDEV